MTEAVAWGEHPEMVELMRREVPGHTWDQTADAFERAFGTRLTRAQVAYFRTRYGVRSGVTGAGRFRRGQPSRNKGHHWDDYMSPEAQERCRATQFRRGQVPHNAVGKPVGYETVRADGYAYVKVAERPTPGTSDNYRLKHVVVWEREHGRPLPPCHKVVFANRDRSDLSPGNLVLVSEAELLLINRYHVPYHDRESLEAAVAWARLRSGIARAELRPRTCGCCGRVFVPEYRNQRTCRACLDDGHRVPKRGRGKAQGGDAR
mgnify:CR=1 FL=1